MFQVKGTLKMPKKKEPENLVNQSMVLDQFLSTLVKSVAKGQTALQQYYKEDEQGRNSTVAYTIPSVSLEIKLNFTMTETKGISFLFKKTKETSSEVFSSLKLNLAAIPNPQHQLTQEVYTVQAGDTLKRIAEKFNVSVNELIKWNTDKISDPDRIEKGMVLTLFL
jgi:LysM repeat protein